LWVDATAVGALPQIGAALTWADAGAIETPILGAAATRGEDARAVRALPLAGAALIERVDAGSVIAPVLVGAASVRGAARTVGAGLAPGAAASFGAAGEPAVYTDDLVAFAAEWWDGVRAAVLGGEAFGVADAELLAGATLASLGAEAAWAAAPALVDAVKGAQLRLLRLFLAFFPLAFALSLCLHPAMMRLACSGTMAIPLGLDHLRIQTEPGGERTDGASSQQTHQPAA
jgi:hypothetical protein